MFGSLSGMLGEEFPRGRWPGLWLRFRQTRAVAIACDGGGGSAGESQTMRAIFERRRRFGGEFGCLDRLEGIRQSRYVVAHRSGRAWSRAACCTTFVIMAQVAGAANTEWCVPRTTRLNRVVAVLLAWGIGRFGRRYECGDGSAKKGCRIWDPDAGESGLMPSPHPASRFLLCEGRGLRSEERE